MRRRLSKTWRVVKWMAVMGCCLLGAFWMATRYASFGYCYNSSDPTHDWTCGAYVSLGVIQVSFRTGTIWIPKPADGHHWSIHKKYKKWMNFAPVHAILPRGGRWSGLGHWGTTYYLPIWLLIFIGLMPTVMLFYLDRSYPQSHCQNCSYDLTGNESGVCPECGEGT